MDTDIEELLRVMSMMSHEEPTLMNYVMNNAHPKMQVAALMLLGMHIVGKEKSWDLIEQHFAGVMKAAQKKGEE